uniref:Putative secreted protein n=1 Tax=Panstrongylus lignarius TaxID=156445 RepID=A0A224Y6G0_9HEMI
MFMHRSYIKLIRLCPVLVTRKWCLSDDIRGSSTSGWLIVDGNSGHNTNSDKLVYTLRYYLICLLFYFY